MADEIEIGSKAIKQIQQLRDELLSADQALIKLSQNALQAGKNIGGISTPSALNKSGSDNSKTIAELERQKNIIKELEIAIKKLSYAKQTNNKVSAEESVNQRILNQNALNHAKSTSSLVSNYQKLNLEHRKLIESAQNLGVKYGVNSVQFRKASAEANVLDIKLKQIDSTLGRSQRNVGNYQNSFNGLGNALSQLGFIGGAAGVVALGVKAFDTTKELQSLNLALKSVTETESNFAEQQSFLSRISEKYGADLRSLTAEYVSFYVSAKDKLAGNEIQGIFEDITKSGSALGLSNDSLKRSFVALNQMLSKGTVASEELRGQLAEALPGSVQAMVKAVQKLHPEIKDLNEKGLFEMIKAGKILASEVLPETARQLVLMTGADKAEGVITLTKLTNQLGNSWTRMITAINNSDSSGFGVFVKNIVSGLSNIADFTGMLFQNENQLQQRFMDLGKNKGLNEYQAILKNISGTTKEQQEITKKALLERERENIRVNQAIVASEKKKRESITGGNRALFHLQTKMEEDALVQVGKSAAIMKKIREDELSKNKKVVASVKTNELTAKEKADLEKKQKEAEKTQEEYLRNKYRREISDLERTKEIRNDELDNFKGGINEKIGLSMKLSLVEKDIILRKYKEEKRLAKGNSDLLQIAENDKITKLEDSLQLNAKRISSYYKDLFDIAENEVPKSIFGDKYKMTDEQKESLKEHEEKVKQTAENINNYLKSFSDEFVNNSGFTETFKMLNKEIEGFGDNFSVTFNAIAESAQEAFNFIGNISQQNFENENIRLQNQYDTAIKFAGGSAVAEAKLAEDLEKKKKEISIREAKAKQKQAIFNIAIDTAQAIMATVGKTGFAGLPLALTLGVLGAAQIAMVASQKIPQYWMGGTHDGGLMMVNDGSGSNYRETIVTPDGNIHKPQGKNVIMNAPSGTEIFTHDQWNDQMNNMLKGNGINWSFNQSQTNSITKEDMKSAMMEAIGEQPQYHSNFDANGASNYIMKKGNITKTASNRGNSIKQRFT